MTDDERRVFDGLVASAYASATVAALALDVALNGANLIKLDDAKDAEVAARGVRRVLTACVMNLRQACSMV